MGLIDGKVKPFNQGKLLNNNALRLKNMKQVKGLTVQKVNGFTESIEAVLKKYQADVETMEGAAFFQACLTEGVNFAQIRAISNYVEPRNRANWLIQEAILNLNKTVVDLVKKRLL